MAPKPELNEKGKAVAKPAKDKKGSFKAVPTGDSGDEAPAKPADKAKKATKTTTKPASASKMKLDVEGKTKRGSIKLSGDAAPAAADAEETPAQAEAGARRQEQSKAALAKWKKLKQRLGTALLLIVYFVVGMLVFCSFGGYDGALSNSKITDDLDDDFGNIRGHYSPIDSLYFSIVTVTTVGYGDLKPAYQFEKLFVTFYALFGVSIIGNVMIAWITEKQKVMAEKMKKAQAEQTRKMMEKRGGDDRSVKSAERVSAAGSALSKFYKCECVPAKFRPILRILLRLLTSVVVVATIVETAEGWGPLDSFYYCVITATSVGYGDFYPTHEPDRLMACLYIPIFIIQLAAFLSAVAKLVSSGATQDLEESGGMKPITLDEEKVAEMAAFGGHTAKPGQSAKIPVLTFVKFVLVQSGKCTEAELKGIASNFVNLSGGDGFIDKEDIARISRAAAKREKAQASEVASGTGQVG